MLVRRLAEAPVEEWHRLRTHVLMDAGELGSRNLSVTWLELPAGAEQTLRSHEEAEQVYVVVRGAGTMSVAGDTQQVAEGDLILVPPATDHSIANDGDSRAGLRLGPVAAGRRRRALRRPAGRGRAVTTTTKTCNRNRVSVRATRAPASGTVRAMPELSRSQIVVYGAVAVALLLVGARAIRAEGSGGSVQLLARARAHRLRARPAAVASASGRRLGWRRRGRRHRSGRAPRRLPAARRCARDRRGPACRRGDGAAHARSDQPGGASRRRPAGGGAEEGTGRGAAGHAPARRQKKDRSASAPPPWSSSTRSTGSAR